MKKNLIVLSTVIAAFGLTAFILYGSNSRECIDPPKKCSVKFASFDNVGAPRFVFDISTRFNTTVSKQDIHNAKSILDVIPIEADWQSYDIIQTKVGILSEEGEKVRYGMDPNLNDEQVDLLKTLEYSNNFYIKAQSKEIVEQNQFNEFFNLSYYITVVPETQAAYQGEKEDLLDYLRAYTKLEVALVEIGKVKPGKIFFTIDKGGKVSDARLESSCGYPTIDEKLIDMIKSVPGSWTPAINEAGQNIQQVLTLSFGELGC